MFSLIIPGRSGTHRSILGYWALDSTFLIYFFVSFTFKSIDKRGRYGNVKEVSFFGGCESYFTSPWPHDDNPLYINDTQLQRERKAMLFPFKQKENLFIHSRFKDG